MSKHLEKSLGAPDGKITPLLPFKLNFTKERTSARIMNLMTFNIRHNCFLMLKAKGWKTAISTGGHNGRDLRSHYVPRQKTLDNASDFAYD